MFLFPSVILRVIFVLFLYILYVNWTFNVSQEYVSSNKDTILSQMHHQPPSASEDVIIQGVSQDAQAGEGAVITYVHGKDDTASTEEV